MHFDSLEPKEHRAIRLRAVIALCLIALGIVLGTYLVFKPSALTPQAQLAQSSSQLYITFTDYVKGFDEISNHRQAANEQFKTLSSLSTICKRIQQDARSTTANNQETTAAGLNTNSLAICDDLEPLVNEFVDLYEPIRPIQSIAPTAKRYQSLPIIRDQVKNNHLRAVEEAQAAYRSRSTSGGEFESVAVSELTSLAASIRSGGNLGYLPSVAAFQNKLFVEQGLFWNTYADAASLLRLLASQTSGYCKVITAPPISEDICRQADDTAN